VYVGDAKDRDKKCGGLGQGRPTQNSWEEGKGEKEEKKI